MATMLLWFIVPIFVILLVVVLKDDRDPTDDIRMYFTDLEDLD